MIAGLTGGLTLAVVMTLGAQSSTTTTTKIDMTGGKHVKVTGCVEDGLDGGYLLTHVADKSGTLQRYQLVSNSDFFPKHVGHRVEVEGRAADRTHGRVNVKSDTNTDGVNAHVSTTARTDPSNMRYLGADHMKMIAASCP
jgi:hypothetical protein